MIIKHSIAASEIEVRSSCVGDHLANSSIISCLSSWASLFWVEQK